ncbi:MULTISPECIES: restriction endonuclease subunit S [Bacillus]|uniref:restriction endonuclease subunit S n=1 Tax=Bacillus TaxID=1386 RepID=UPI0006248B3A|nr:MULTISPECIES: restriction endonuclease subunit S [Bacillus]UXZ16836.1 restriction endonuclease subunit S [Bacillus siamensis]AKF31612.1 hypothetical protein AAV29_14025 [Bacillus velezensis]KMN53844.1 hypothetical protein VK94_16780 [Bacillus sp. LK7]MBR8695273.1 hypothetical protein [Bacillus velezensis]MBY6041321.1 restriction endonuclease subunit S [Bacillus velezensis]
MSKKKKTIEELLEEAIIPEEKERFVIPKNWIWTQTGSITDVIGGGTPKSTVKEYFEDGDIPWLTPADLSGYNDMYISRGKRNITEVGLANSSAKILPSNTVLLSSRAPIGYVTIASNDICTNQGFKSFLPSNAYYPEYLYWYLKFSTTYLESMASGTTFKELSGSKCKEIALPLPSLNEQKRIANKVERLLNKVEEAKQLIEEAKETFELRRAAILDKAFRGELTRKWREEHPDIENAEVLYDKIISLIKPKKFEIIEEQSEYIPCKWKWVRLGEVVQVNPPKKKLNEVSEEQKCTFIPMPAVSDKTGKIEEPEEREYRKVKKGYTFFLENDVLFAKITPCMENGKSAIARQLKNGFGYGSTEFHVLRTSEYVNEQYIHYLVRSQRFRAKAKREMTGAVGQQRVPKEFLLNYPFPLPPKKEQDAIVNILDDIFAKDNCSKFNLQLESELDILKQCILSKAFRGELGTNDPSEESAVELLKEVLQEQVK